MRTIDVYEAQELNWALRDVIDYLTYTGCGEPECCGQAPEEEMYKKAMMVLNDFGLILDDYISECPDVIE